MPGRIKTAPSGAIFACPSGSIFAGCDPCGGDDTGCAFRVVSGGYVTLILNLVRYTTGIPEVDSEGNPILLDPFFPEKGYRQRAFYTHYWGDTVSINKASDFCKAFDQENGGESARSGYIGLRSNLPAENGTDNTQRISTEAKKVHVVSPELPNGVATIDATEAILYPESTAWLYLTTKLSTDSETAYHEAPSRLNVELPIHTTHMSDELCDSSIHVTIYVNRQTANCLPGGIGLTVNIPYGGGTSPEHAIRCKYFATGYTQDHPNQITVTYAEYDEFLHVPFNEWFGSPTSFTAVITYDQFGINLGNVVFYRPGIPGPIALYTPTQFADADSAGVPLGAGTAASGSIFLTAYFGLCPGLPPPRNRVGIGDGTAIALGGCDERTFTLYVRNGSPGGLLDTEVPETTPPVNNQCHAAIVPGAYSYGVAPMATTVYPGDVVTHSTALRRVGYIFGLGWFYSTGNYAGGFIVPETMDPYVVTHVPSGYSGELGLGYSGTVTITGVSPLLRN